MCGIYVEDVVKSGAGFFAVARGCGMSRWFCVGFVGVLAFKSVAVSDFLIFMVAVTYIYGCKTKQKKKHKKKTNNKTHTHTHKPKTKTKQKHSNMSICDTNKQEARKQTNEETNKTEQAQKGKKEAQKSSPHFFFSLSS